MKRFNKSRKPRKKKRKSENIEEVLIPYPTFKKDFEFGRARKPALKASEILRSLIHFSNSEVFAFMKTIAGIADRNLPGKRWRIYYAVTSPAKVFFKNPRLKFLDTKERF